TQAAGGASHDHGTSPGPAPSSHTHPAASGDQAATHDHDHGGDGAGPASPGTAHTHDASACHPTPTQQAAADKLIADTKASLARWNDQNQAMADGYIPYPPVPAGWAQHYVNFGLLDDGRTLDPAHPESLLYALTDQGYRPISALYILPHAW